MRRSIRFPHSKTRRCDAWRRTLNSDGSIDAEAFAAAAFVLHVGIDELDLLVDAFAHQINFRTGQYLQAFTINQQFYLLVELIMQITGTGLLDQVNDIFEAGAATFFTLRRTALPC
ncbi:hypothetical protein ULF88_00340 [Halopseudomonas pachastrellae]|nr:hypothetical protein [Halopseudomonas pachastrellae]